ncbi:MAG TPA: MBL fold metallo-hydrolase [Candidatus Angelobacter sp.]|nr:MBL fold metallo-hydrolase [Candidatus Angelobacter sp.]
MIQFQNESVTVFQSALFQTTSTVVQTKDIILVVDPNWLPTEIEAIQRHVSQIQGDRPLYLLFTHGDFDHVIGYQAFPGANVIGSRGLVHHPQKAEKVRKIHDFDNENYINRAYPITFPEVDVVVDKSGQQLVIGETTLTFYLSPGHTHDGLFTLIEPLGIWISGDYLSDFERPFIYYSAKAYKETLHCAAQILATHKPLVLVPGHGQTTNETGEMKRRIQLSEDYLERLITAVVSNNVTELAALEKEMPFPSAFTKQCHGDNIDIIRKEYLEK